MNDINRLRRLCQHRHAQLPRTVVTLYQADIAAITTQDIDTVNSPPSSSSDIEDITTRVQRHQFPHTWVTALHRHGFTNSLDVLQIPPTLTDLKQVIPDITLGDVYKFKRIQNTTLSNPSRTVTYDFNQVVPTVKQYTGAKHGYNDFITFYLNTVATFGDITIVDLFRAIADITPLDTAQEQFLKRLLLQNVDAKICEQFRTESGINTLTRFVCLYGKQTNYDMIDKIRTLMQVPDWSTTGEAIEWWRQWRPPSPLPTDFNIDPPTGIQSTEGRLYHGDQPRMLTQPFHHPP